MNNLVFLIGRLENYIIENNKLKLMIYYSGDEIDVTLPIHMKFLPTQNVIDVLEEDMLIGLKCHLALDENNNIMVIGDKMTFLTSKNKGGENNESK